MNCLSFVSLILNGMRPTLYLRQRFSIMYGRQC